MKLYLDTSVYGGFYDKEFEKDTRVLFKYIIQNNVSVSVSDVLRAELDKSPEKVRLVLNQISNTNYVGLSKQASDLASIYIKEGALGKKNLNDARHIAIATIEKVDVIASWNFKHMIHFLKVELYNAINIREGYRAITIHSPTDLIKSLELS